MQEENILNEITTILKKVFDRNNLLPTMETTARDIKEWDSMNHVILIAEIEKFYSIKFNLDDMLNFESVGDICRAVKKFIN